MATSSRPRATSNLLPRPSLTEPIQRNPPEQRPVTSSGRDIHPTTRERPVTSSGPPDPKVEVLYHHPTVRIIAFTASSLTKNEKSAGESEELGTLPWSSKLERTIAIGQMRIYRPPGSVAFLSCGTVIKPILPKSQCWCVDEESSKFVLKIKRPQYWRIEMHSAAKTDTERFKELLGTILIYEKTRCPFARGFAVELPELPAGPILRRPWKRFDKSKTELVSVSETQRSEEVENRDEFYLAPSGNSSEEIPRYTDATPQSFSQHENSDAVSDSFPPGPSRNNQLTVVTLCKLKEQSRAMPTLGTSSSSSESFHSAQSWHSTSSPFPASPSESTQPSPFSSLFDENLQPPTRWRQNSNFAVPTGTPGSWGPPSEASTRPSTPNLVYMSDDESKSISTMSEISTPPPARRLNTSNQTHSEPQICHQAPPTSPTRRSTLSPFTSSVFSPFRQTTHKQLSFTPQHEHSNLQVARQIPGIVMRKTCQILLAPPSHLINIMLSMAAKISAGEWKGGWMTWGGDGDVAFEVEEDREDMVDDFGFCLRKKPSSSSSLGPDTDVRRRSFRAEIPGSWETD